MATTSQARTAHRQSVQPTEMTGLQRMAKRMWAPWLVMGAMIVGIAFLVGLYHSAIEATYFASSKATREAAEAGSTLAGYRVTIETIKIWLPAFKFLGMGMLLGGITFLLATILGTLRVAGGSVQEALAVQIKTLAPPWTAKLFPAVMMMGMMVLMANLIIAIWLSTVAASFWDHSIAKELDLATSGSALLRQLGTINAVTAWIEPLKFVGVALLFTGIGLALATIVRAIRFQSQRIVEIFHEA